MEINVEQENSISLENTLFLIEDILDEKTGVISEIFSPSHFSDEPSIEVISAKLCNSSYFGDDNVKAGDFQTGKSMKEKEAKVKAVGEAIERYCASIYYREDMIYASYDKIASDETLKVNPHDLDVFTAEQKKNIENTGLDSSDKFWWRKSFSVLDQKEKWLPAQAIYLPYTRKKEPLLRNSISTGLASGVSNKGAIYRGLMEIIEREAFIIAYLNELSLYSISEDSLKSNPEVEQLIEKIEAKNLELEVLEVPTDAPAKVFITILIDRTKKGPSIVLGASADSNNLEAIKDSICEALHVRPWLRKVRLTQEKKNIEPSEIENLEERGLYWYDKDMIEELDFWLENGKEKDIELKDNRTDSKNLKKLIKFFSSTNMPIYVSDITTEDVIDTGIKAYRTIVPKACPLYLVEKYSPLDNDRLYELPVKLNFLEKPKKKEELNKTPHPFL